MSCCRRVAIMALLPVVVLLAARGHVSARSECVTGAPRELVVIRGDASNEHLGGSMARAGDVNGDGLSDLLVGDSRDEWLPGERRCYLYYGRSVLDTVPDVVIHQFEADTTDPHDDDDDEFGADVSGGCDVNGDGYDDILITSPWWFLETGKVYLYHGGDPFDLGPDVAVAAWGSSWMTVFWSTCLRGRLIADVNGDGYAEMVCLVKYYTPDVGAHLYFGGAPMDSVHDLSLQGDGYFEPGVVLGSSIATGDLNGDGCQDVALGSYGAWGDDPPPHAAWVYFGGAEIDTIPEVHLCGPAPFSFRACVPGDLNGDGYEDVVASHGCSFSDPTIRYARGFVYFGGEPMDSLADLEFAGRTEWGYRFGLAGGDLNNDGFADLLVSDISYYSQNGRLAIYLGGADMDTIPDSEMAINAASGAGLAFLGDMTGDGWPEFAVSDPQGPGAIYIYTLAPEAAGDEPPDPPVACGLRLAPNPTTSAVTVTYLVPRPADVDVRIYDLRGRLVRTLFSEVRAGGLYTVRWDGSDGGQPAPPGKYVVRLSVGDASPGDTQTAAIVLTR